MNLAKLIVEYFCSQKEHARLTIPAVGQLSVKLYPARTARNAATGAKVEIPVRREVLFSQYKEGADVSNVHFTEWMKSSQGIDASTMQLELNRLADTISGDLKKSRRAEIPGLGQLLLKDRPPRGGRNPATGEYLQIPGRAAMILKKQWSLYEALNPERVEAPTCFETLPTTPSSIPSGLSTFNLAGLPPPLALWKLCQSLAVLAKCRDDSGRYMVVQSLKPGINFASMSNGQGDDCQIFFIGGDALIRGFAHEAPMASWYNRAEPWPGTLEGLPGTLHEALFHDYLNAEDMSFCVWQTQSEGAWQKGKITRFPAAPSEDPDGSGFIFQYFPCTPAEWIAAESDRASEPIDVEVVEHIYHHHPLTPSMIQRLNPNCTIEMQEFAGIGYPIA